MRTYVVGFLASFLVAVVATPLVRSLAARLRLKDQPEPALRRHGKPVLCTRESTERPEGVEAGVVRLVGTDRARIVASADELLDDPAAYARMARVASPYGDRRAAGRILDALRGSDAA
jgi:UDP-N-acetylglucosamine 2-epimerase